MLRESLFSLAVGALLSVQSAAGDCTTGKCIPGGGPEATDCYAEFSGTGLVLNSPSFDPAEPKPKKELRCFDGDAGCDSDGLTNGRCVFNVDLCLFNTDPNLPGCSPDGITSLAVKVRDAEAEAEALRRAAVALPAETAACTTARTVTVPLEETYSGERPGQRTVKVRARTTAGTDGDVLRLTCVPRGWPAHGYDHRNHRASTRETTLTAANVHDLRLRWEFETGAGVTSTPTVAGKLVYVSSWNGVVYALSRKTGKPKWSFDTGSAGVLGVQSSVTVTADGRVLFGDSLANLYCLDGRTGKLLWQRSVGNPAVDHIWASPTVASNRVFMGIASHNDVPCTQGRLVALDLDTGETLWTRTTVPDRICDNDTSLECTSDAQCGGGRCSAARGAGVTATVAVDRSGESVYMNTVGCFTFPSVGDSDSIFKLDAATGETRWVTRVNAPEQFGFCGNDTSLDCGGDADCAGGTCTTKLAYHDFGFLNGPLLIDRGTRTLIVSASKNGTLYALDEATGDVVWTNAVQPTPVSPGFAGFGLFNGAVGFANGRLHAALYQLIPAQVCADDLSRPCGTSADCGGGTCLPAPEHLMAFDADDGISVWADEIGVSWGSIALGGGVVFAGTNDPALFCDNDLLRTCANDSGCESGGSCVAINPYYAYDAASGERLSVLPLPDASSSGASIVDGTVFVGYGIFDAVGGVRAYALP